MSWDKGRATINELLGHGHLERVPANTDEAQYLLGVARRHLVTAQDLADDDPEIAYDALYARRPEGTHRRADSAGAAAHPSGRPRSGDPGGARTVRAPLGDVLRPYRRLRRQRAQGDYLASEGAISSEDVNADLPAATAIVDAAARVVDSLPVFTG